jgi:hypothetical protein
MYWTVSRLSNHHIFSEPGYTVLPEVHKKALLPKFFYFDAQNYLGNRDLDPGGD